MFLCQTGWNPDCSLPDNKVEKSSFGKSRKSHGIYISAAAGAFLLVGAHQSGSTCSSWSLSSLPLSLCQTHSFSVISASLLSIFSLLPLVLKQAVYCVCSAEQPALKDVCECLSQPACQTVLIPSEAWLTSSSPCPFFFSPSAFYWLMLPSWPADMLAHLSVPACLPPCGPITRRVTLCWPHRIRQQSEANDYESIALLAIGSHDALQQINVLVPQGGKNKEGRSVSLLGVIETASHCLPHVGS